MPLTDNDLDVIARARKLADDGGETPSEARILLAYLVAIIDRELLPGPRA